jgi:hypothetical protein
MIVSVAIAVKFHIPKIAAISTVLASSLLSLLCR